MNKSKIELKFDFIPGLREIVLKEISQYPTLRIVRKEEDSVYLDFVQDFTEIKRLRSISKAYIVVQNSKYTPPFLSTHKSIFGDLIEIVLHENIKIFKTFEVICAGTDSPKIRSIAEYIQSTYKIAEKEDGDMKIHIVKTNEIWEVGVQITPKPLSFRDYKIKNMSGAMNPTIAYAMNSLCGLEKANSYLNIFSGSATLLIEAGQCYPNLKQLVGFDNDKKHISLAVQNIKKAGLIKKIQLKEKNIFDKPDLGMFDVIASDLPFGMCVSKNEDLGKLYGCFVEYCQEILNKEGRLAVYTNEHEILKASLLKSKFRIVKTLELKFMSSVNAYLRPKIFVCELK